MEKKAYISKLVVEGFKSYGTKRREIPLGEGFVAVVGPNGAGKSNIGDAIAFALGLSTARALRAKNLSHLIFSKNGKKAPHALVEVHFKNLGAFPVEEEEVVVSRKVTADGRSTFRINGVPVRERDLKDFLAKAGIYENGYNVVYQGDIVRFLKQTPLERRRIIEEVAGIGEYEKKKEKALKDLGEVELKISEIKLLLEEIKLQLDRLKEERDKLLRYRELEKKKRELELKLLLKEREKLLREGEKLSSQERELKEELEKVLKEAKEKEEELLSLERKLKEVNDLIMPHKEKIGKLLARQEHLKKELSLKEKERQELLKRKTHLLELVENLKKDVRNLEEEVSRLREELNFKREELKKLEEEEKALLESLQKEESRLKVTLEEVKRLEEEKKFLTEKLEELRAKRSGLEVEAEKLKLRIKKEEEEIEKLKVEEGEALRAYEEKEEELKRLKTIKAREEAELKKLEESLRAYEKKLSEVKKALEETIREKGAVEREVEGRVSPSELFKEVKGVYGTVAELIRVKDPQHVLAVEVAGGGRLRHLVVEDEEVARACIEKAKRENLGRFSFLPLNRIRVQKPLLRYPRVKGAVDFAVNLVEYDPKFEKVVYFVFGDTLVVEDFDSAKAIGIGNYRMVSLEGELFEKSGVITGGSKREGGELSLAFYEEKLKELLRREKTLKEEEERLYKKLKEVRSLLSEKFALLKVLEKKLEELPSEGKEEIQKRYREKLKRAQEYLQVLRQKLSQKEEELRRLREEEEYLKEKLENLKLKERDLSRYYSAEGLEEKRRAYALLVKRVREKREELARLEKALQEKQAELKYLLKESEEKEREALYAEEKAEEVLKEGERIKKELRELEEQVKEAEGSVYQLFKKREELEEGIKELRSLLGGLKLKEEELREKLGRVERSLSVLREKLRNLEEELSAYSDLQVKEVREGVQSLKEALRETVSLLEGMGSVNFRAEEDYEAEKKRYEDYKEKLEQLKKESKAIKELIEEIEKKKKKVFLEAFRAINRSLGRIFAFLSPGGKARMILENPEEPFEGGVLLTVKPRGKDVQYLEAMSGGEKTLAALALIFAIQEYKPSPFYYFDEVDAHLDEANARKVGELIREKSKEAQFIVVTLREVLSSLADRVIGVTARGGVSEPVFLKNYALEEVLKE